MPDLHVCHDSRGDLHQYSTANAIGRLYLGNTASELYPPASGQSAGQLSLDNLSHASQLAASPSVSLCVSGQQPTIEAGNHSASSMQSKELRESPTWLYGCPQSMSMASEAKLSVTQEPSCQMHYGLNHLSTPGATGGRVGQGHYMPVSNLYASLQPMNDARGHGKVASQAASATSYQPPPPSTSSSMYSALAASPNTAWATPGDHLQQSTGVAEHRAGHRQGTSHLGGARAATGDLEECPVEGATRGWRGGAQSSGLLQALHGGQPQRTRRARLGTEATADAQPNSEGAKAEESRQLSRIKAQLSEHPADAHYTLTLLSAVDVRLSLPGLTKLISKLNKAGQWRQGLTVFQVLPSLGLVPDATVANAALGACDRGGDGAAAWSIFEIMEVCALEADAISYKALVAALSKSGHWRRCVLVFIRAIETGVPLEAMTVMAIISALNDAGHPQLAEGAFCCAFASALALQPLLVRPWPAEQQEASGLGGESPAAAEGPNSHPTSLPPLGATGPHSLHEPRQSWSSGSGHPQQPSGQPAAAAAPAMQAVTGSPLLMMTSDESIRAAVSAASALDDPTASPRNLLSRLQVLQAQARHASQTTRLNTYLQMYGDLATLESAVCASDTEIGTSSAETQLRTLHDHSLSQRESPKKGRPSPMSVVVPRPIESMSNSTASDMLFAIRPQPASHSGSDAARLPSAATGSPVSSRDAAPAAATATAASVAPGGLRGGGGSGSVLVSHTRRALSGLVHDPMARACCNAMLAGYANATPAAGDRAAALLQILKESEALEPDVVAYNITVRALALSGNLQAAVDTLAQLTASGHQAGPVSFLPLLAATAARGSVRSVLELWVQMQRLHVTPDISCMRAFALAALRSGNSELVSEALSRFSDQIATMSTAKAAAEASALVLAHAEYVPRTLWAPPGMAPLDLCHNLTIQGSREDRPAGSDGHGTPTHGTLSPSGAHRDRRQRPGPNGTLHPAAPPHSPSQLGLMYAVPQAPAGAAPAGPAPPADPAANSFQFSVNVVYPTASAGQHAAELWPSGPVPPHIGGLPPMQYRSHEREPGGCRFTC